MTIKQVSSDYIPLHELENLYHYLQGAHSACDHENSSATFHQACHKLDEIITHIKINTPNFYVAKV